MKIQYFLTAIFLILLLTVSCEKPEPPDEPTQKIKYISKVLNKDSLEVCESYTWDSQKRLKKFNTRLSGWLQECSFFYNAEGLISHVDFFSFEYGYGNYMFYWKNDNKLDYIDFNLVTANENQMFQRIMKYEYSFDNESNCSEIILEHYAGMNYKDKYFFEWEKGNLTKCYTLNGADTSYVTPANNIQYDNNPSWRTTFSKIPLFHFGVFVYIPSNNNPIKNGYYNFEYDYDEDGYPIRQYYIVDGKKELMYFFVYEELPE
ncbi:hypothetical protein LJC25_03085 [Bacteroidales bacterium OttesenSCG-928-K03]|nr:hypothetical protein [Odoribacter sp. OttesenSCG-928-L07]MDL2242694.1 hypothetical protein [Bacteroidales bacterium OttesenSCG-928-K03]